MSIKLKKFVFLFIIFAFCALIINIEKVNADTACERDAKCNCSCSTGTSSDQEKSLSEPVTRSDCQAICNLQVKSCEPNICNYNETLKNEKCVIQVSGNSCPTGYTYSSQGQVRVDDPEIGGGGFGKYGTECVDILGQNMTKIVHGLITVMRIFGAIVAIVHGMILLIPAVVAKDAEAFKKATSKCVKLLIVLAAIGIFPAIVRLIGTLLGYDVSCVV